ncbi:endonuclease/exonuclease/phosphatase family protein [uncultured Pseudodesulfovibrio sp.]|uniref:endonuclease/exonuclease/phosphatase family protein n=1 Tax=uncultured Pseudodesulfovibrio sp. TaxID=2035858 RepID=UPI0029C64561|nr:endonuclease/exonuclease/phosphatase family protein [uncultured Pseudodesulfovibrio sp.]
MSAGHHPPLRAATYNIHGWRGPDNRLAPERIFRVIAALDADILALQEVISPQKAGAPCSLREVAAELGYHVTFGQTLLRADTRYGNGLLSRIRPDRVERHDLSVPGREPRGALECRFSFNGRTVKTVTTHLGLRRKERADQMRRLTPLVAENSADATLLMGDFNDWFAWSGLRRDLHALAGRQPAPRTFPAPRPFLSLDRILVMPKQRLASLSALRGAGTAGASDHLPLLAEVALD